jgi:hemerythrin-like domain-containing protein
MCEYCGCQSLPAIAELTREHDRIVDLIGAARTAHRRGDVAAMIELCLEISAVLDPHTEVEEHGLFPALAADFPEHVAALQAEHHHVEAVIACAVDGSARTDATWPARMVEALDVLRLHILKEQDGVFPAALANLSNEQWDRLTEIRQIRVARQQR